MTQAAHTIPAPIPVRIPIRQIVPWAVLVGLLALIALYFVTTEQGAASVIANHYVHEFVHDGRHLLAFPCH
ncbi:MULTISPECIES: CbtB domain-containing protein [Amycolatopsis]|uniref:CbtB-domain containing protein n=1 Tax=Amycolatopsis dongchuanensis TaxID=1070866 RepID=A0ABP9QC73_9PSEU